MLFDKDPIRNSMKGESIIITGVDMARQLADTLVGDLICFSVEPLADEQFVFTVKTEDLDRTVARIRERQPRHDLTAQEEPQTPPLSPEKKND